MLNLTYYMRDNCQLCNEGKLQLQLALSELRDEVVQLTEVNIDQDDKLQEEYMVRIPVLADGEEIIQEGMLDFVTIYDYVKEKSKQ
ncbi:MAG TPA: glutaredoxin family protein [Candidatus Jeotgalicoccus stercoravium]|nr:glutaredoxin family protein [Candidatus Jeotgalicoccus stercoravium]